jgi:predicted nucleic-acid-binding Zn-ribbon protein
MTEKSLIPVCMKCGSTNLKNSFLMSPMELAKVKEIKTVLKGFTTVMSPDIYLCQDCGYYGFCPSVDTEKVAEFQTNIKKKS